MADFKSFRDPSDMSLGEMLAQVEMLRSQLEALNAFEPDDMESDEHAAWGEQHEEMEDQVDDIMELLSELR